MYPLLLVSLLTHVLYQVIQGSSKLFAALLRQCLTRDVIAICRYIARSNASPVFVAMVPQVCISKPNVVGYFLHEGGGA